MHPVDIFKVANSVDCDQIPRYVMSDLGLHCLNMPVYPNTKDNIVSYLISRVCTCNVSHYKNSLTYSRLSLSRLRLSRITSYLKV